MQRRIQISGGLLASLLTIFGECSQVLYLPTTLFALAGQEAWLAMLLGHLAGSLVGLLGIVVCQRHPGLMPAQIARRVLGNWLGGAVGLLYGAFFIWVYALTLRDLLDFAQIVLLPQTPAWVLCLLVVLPVLYMAWEGLEPIARVCFVLLVAKGSMVFLAPLMVSKEFTRLNVDPLFYQGFRSVIRAAGMVVPWFVESLVVMSVVPNVKPGARLFRAFYLGIAGATALLLFLIIPASLAFGPDLASRFTFPVYTLVQMVTIGRTIERIEMVLVSVWIFGIFVKLALCLYAAASAWTHALGDSSRYRKMAILGTIAGTLLITIWSGPLSLMSLTRTRFWMISTTAFALLLPLVLLIGSLIWGRQRRRGDLNA